MSASTSPAEDQTPTWAGWRIERVGLIGSLGLGQLIVLAVATAPVFLALAGAHWSDAGLCLLLLICVALFVIPRYHERTMYRWVADWTMDRLGTFAGMSDWISKAASGSITKEQLDQLDLPGPLSGLKVHDGPPSPAAQMRRVCLVQHPNGWWSVTASVTHKGLSLQDQASSLRWAKALGRALSGLARANGPARRMSIYVRTVPDDGTERALWHQQHVLHTLPAAAKESLDRLESATLATSVMHEIYVTVMFEEHRLAREAKPLGGGVKGRAEAIYRMLPVLATELASMGCSDITWLDTRQMAGAIRSGYSLGDSIGQALASASGVPRGTHPGAAGPAVTPAPSARSYGHGGYRTAAYSIVLPELGTEVGRLSPLLTPRAAGERRAIALHYEIIGSDKAQKAIGRDMSSSTLRKAIKEGRGFRVGQADKLHEKRLAAQESRLASGYDMVRVAGAAAVTVPEGNDIDAHAGLLEASARQGGYELMRLELVQPAAFTAAVLPLGIGLPRR